MKCMRNKRLLIIFGILLTLTLLIAIGSAVFSIRRVDAFCYNADDEGLMEQVLKHKDKIMGKSIFSLDEDQLIYSIESRVGGIKIINVERLFPNRVSINYVKLYDYFEVLYDGKYYISAIDGKINRVQNESSGDKVIRVIIQLDEKPNIGAKLTSAKHFDALQDIIEMLERLNFRETDATAIISSVDLKFSENEIYIKTRGGTLIKLMKYDNAGEKLRKALSLYKSKPEIRNGGTITVTNSDIVTYSPETDDIYEESNQ